MKNKYWVLIIAALTVIGTFWTQTELGGKKYRTHQHKEYLSVEDTIPDVQEAINAEQIFVFQNIPPLTVSRMTH